MGDRGGFGVDDPAYVEGYLESRIDRMNTSEVGNEDFFDAKLSLLRPGYLALS